MRHTYLMFALLMLVGLSNCKQEAPIVPIHELTGTWQDYQLYGNGTSVEIEISFEADSSFVQLINLYGIYNDQRITEVSAWFKLEGQITINGASVNFRVDKYTWFDHQYGSESFEETYFGQLYSNCTYRLTDNRALLNLQYAINPAMPDELTRIALKKIE